MDRFRVPSALCIGLLVLAACGAGRSQVAASHTSPAAPANSGPAARASPVSIRIGPYTQVFATPLPANRAQAGVVEGFREAWILWDKSQDVWHLVAPVRDYVTGRALTHLLAAVSEGKARHLVPAGGDRFFKTRVTAFTGHRATVTTCDDASKFKEENPSTRRVDRAFIPTRHQAYIFETWRMVRLSGHWAITDFSVAVFPSLRAKPCQP
jgi:hypothetical protein